METRWKSETTDTEWTDNVVGYVNSLLSAVDGGPSTLVRTDCRATLCRIVFRADASKTLLAMHDLAMADKYPFRQAVQSDGGVRTVVAFATKDELSATLPADAGSQP